MKLEALIRDEKGQAVNAMLLLILPALVLVIGCLFDLGNVAAAQAIARDAADLAVQDAAKEIDVAHFAATQEVILAPDAVDVAAYWVDYMTDGHMQVTGLYTTQGGQIVLEGEVSVRTRFLGAVGLSTVRRRVVSVARPRFGAQREGD